MQKQEKNGKAMVLTHFSHISIPPENVRKPKVKQLFHIIYTFNFRQLQVKRTTREPRLFIFKKRELNINLTFSENNQCWYVIIDQIFSNVCAKQWQTFNGGPKTPEQGNNVEF